MGCCDDPTEPKKLDRRELIRLQEQYGELVRDLLTENPERVILKQLNDANRYLLELAAVTRSLCVGALASHRLAG